MDVEGVELVDADIRQADDLAVGFGDQHPHVVELERVARLPEPPLEVVAPPVRGVRRQPVDARNGLDVALNNLANDHAKSFRYRTSAARTPKRSSALRTPSGAQPARS